ncbi:hypothetical protein [Brevibacillus porteri]|uniref:hypothetical protein n=1 Tax=Brevibacillus porteri TaxID=2126350 RepID=UPI00370BE896
MIDLFFMQMILYLMPEFGSKVKLYFPSADEDEGMIMNSVRHKSGCRETGEANAGPRCENGVGYDSVVGGKQIQQ